MRPRWSAALRAVGAALHPDGLVTEPCARASSEDDAAEPVVRAFVFAMHDRALWIGLTGHAIRSAEHGVESLVEMAKDAFLAARSSAEGSLREATLDERAAAIAPREGHVVLTATVDVKLAQLMATTLAVIDLVERN